MLIESASSEALTQKLESGENDYSKTTTDTSTEWMYFNPETMNHKVMIKLFGLIDTETNHSLWFGRYVHSTSAIHAVDVVSRSKFYHLISLLLK